MKLDKFYIGESVSLMKQQMEDNFVDLTITSPPYDDLRSYNGFKFNYVDMLRELYRVTKDGGVVVWVVNDKTHKGSETGTSFKQALSAMEIGFRLHDTMIYEKNNPTPSGGKRYQSSFEYMFVFSKGTPKTFNPLQRDRKYIDYRETTNFGRKADGEHQRGSTSTSTTVKKNNIWKYNVGKNHTTNDSIAFDHPAIFPDRLAEDHILSWSNEGDVVFDPMCGSGTTCKMAYINNRRYIGIDVSKDYIESVCIPRLNEYIKD